MSMVDRLLAQLKRRGLTISAGSHPGQLLLNGPAAEKTPEIVAAVKAFKGQLLAIYAPVEVTVKLPGEPVSRLTRENDEELPPEPEPEPDAGSCQVCKRDVSDPENVDRLRQTNPFCSVGWDRQARQDCPHRQRH